MKLDTKRILLYLGITFGLTWLYCLVALYPSLRGESLNGVPTIAAQLLTMVVMFFPAVGVLLTRLITREGFGDHWLKLNLKGNLKHYLLAWFAPGLLTLLGAGVYFLLLPHQFDPNCTYLASVLESAGAPMEELPIPLNLLMVVQLLQGLVMAPILNCITCFGEEWGWRGYLLPKLSKKLPLIPTLLVSGLIWGLWHAPLTIVGHNYGIGYPGFPFAGIGMMCLFCTVLGILLSYVTLKSGSCIPAIIGHGAVNGIAAIGIYFTPTGGDPFVGPAPMGIIGILPFLATAITLVILWNKKGQSKRGLPMNTEYPQIHLELQDTQWPLEYTDHHRPIARAIVFDEEGYLYFVRAHRDDDFGKATLIETSGGGIEPGEEPSVAILRELEEELGATVRVICKLGVVSDYYNLIHRHNINNYYLCKALSFGQNHLTEDEAQCFHLSTQKLTYEEALQEYEACAVTKVGKLVADRELPILRHAKTILDSLQK